MTIDEKRGIQEQVGQSFAVVSGKGGSGKTLVAVAMAQALGALNYSTLLIDVDFGTGGLTYYLTFTIFSNARVGLADLHTNEDGGVSFENLLSSPKPASLVSNKELRFIRLIPTGDQRTAEPMDRETLEKLFKDVLYIAKSQFDYVIADCRGGIDPQSIAVCSICDEILVVAETDATSIQATQHLVDVLNRHDLKRKIVGFLLNKVMDDPTPLAKAATSFFRSEYLGAIPFDIDATRAYIQGELPSKNSLFSRHVQYCLSNMLLSARSYQNVRTLAPAEFSTVTLRNPETRLGGVLIGTLSVYLAIILMLVSYSIIPTDIDTIANPHLIGVVAGVYCSIVLLSLSESFKQKMGSIFSAYRTIIRRITFLIKP
jgi:flagellar biosynthesis protein FlhG